MPQFKLKFKHETKAQQAEDLQALFLDLLNAEEDPERIQLECGTILKWNPYVMNACFAKGFLTEEELIKILSS